MVLISNGYRSARAGILLDGNTFRRRNGTRHQNRMRVGDSATYQTKDENRVLEIPDQSFAVSDFRFRDGSRF